LEEVFFGKEESPGKGLANKKQWRVKIKGLLSVQVKWVIKS